MRGADLARRRERITHGLVCGRQQHHAGGGRGGWGALPTCIWYVGALLVLPTSSHEPLSSCPDPIWRTEEHAYVSRAVSCVRLPIIRKQGLAS